MKVYLLTHYRNEEELDGFKIIGVFSSESKASDAISALKKMPGFRDYPESFNIGGYEIDKVFWGDGFG
jgi:RHS repeat-associated protein